MRTLVLGIGGFMHDYNCTLVDVDRKLLTMCEAERISRRKHHVIQGKEDMPAPIEKCCRDLGVRIKDISTVVFAHKDDFKCKKWLKELMPKSEFVEVDHHLCHVAGAFFSSGMDRATIVSVDGFGDGSSGLLALGDGNKIEEFTRISEVDSIGLEYLRATVHLGLGGYGSEGKTQGLAAYGIPSVYEDYMNEIQIMNDGGLLLSSKLRTEDSRLAEEGGYMNSQLLRNSFLNDYCPRRILPEPLTDVHNNLAASIQKVLEHVIIEMCLIAKKKAGCDDLVLSGGVSMNSSLNGQLLRLGHFKKIFALPMASDRGVGLGAALYYIHCKLSVPRFFKLESVFYGNEYPDKDAVRAMKKAGLNVSTSSEIVEVAAQALSKSQIVGWFQGRSELGARALGHRSILADPRRTEMKDIVNHRVKHREHFRPFAPAVPETVTNKYFDIFPEVTDLGFMTFTVNATDDAQQYAPAVVHVDRTGRIQTVRKERDGLYSDVIMRFGELTGNPVILNTSFNDMGEPIVETPENALAMFVKSDMDVLCIGNVIGVKK